MLSDRSTSRKPQFKSCCIHWIKLTSIPYSVLKDNFFWLSLQIGQVIRQNIKKQQIPAQIRKHPNLFIPKLCNLFINRSTLVIYCIACQKEILDIYPKYSSPQDLFFIKHQKLNPFKIRSHFLKPIDDQNMYLSNLQNPKSFQKEKSNCALFISTYRNSCLQCAIRLLAFNPTFSSIAQGIDLQKIKSFSFRQLIKVIKVLGTGKYRILDIKEFQEVFFSQFTDYLSYENHNPIKILFGIFKLIENQFGWKDVFCSPKQILETPRLEWEIGKKQYKYSPLKQMLLSKTQVLQICQKCQKQKKNTQLVNYFECLTVEVKNEVAGIPFMKKKVTELNLLKAIQNTLSGNITENNKDCLFCSLCSKNTDHKVKTIIEPGNYLLFDIQQNENIQMTVPKDIDLLKLCPDKFIVNEEGTKFKFIAGIYKKNQQKSSYASQYGVVVYHIQNNRYICFSQRKITQHQSLNIEKHFSVLIYKRQLNESLFPIIKNIKSTLYLIEQEEIQVDNPIPLPDFYQVFLTQNFKVPPLINPFICHHGFRNVDIQQMTKCSKIRYLPIEIYNFLVDQFGGRKIKEQKKDKFKGECQLCFKGLQKFHEIKAVERQAMKYADNFSIKKGEVLIYKPWIESWKTYLYERSKENYNLWGNTPPLQINNFLGMRDNDPKLIDHSKYTKISNQVWMTLVAFHSGGPQLTTKKIVRNNNVKNYINLKLNQAKVLFQQIAQILSPNAKVLFQKKSNSQSLAVVSNKDHYQSQIVSSGSSDQENEQLSIKSASKSKQKSRPKFVISPKDIQKKK